MDIDCMRPFVFENAGGTSYMDSILMAMFFSPSIFDSLLMNNLTRSSDMYLQEYINTYIVQRTRKNISVLSEVINGFRTLCIENGWLGGEYTSCLDQQCVENFYSYIVNSLKGPSIQFKDGSSCSTLTINVPESVSDINIKDLLLTYSDGKQIMNIPSVIPVYLNRFSLSKIKTNIVIPKKIYPFKHAKDINPEYSNISWTFHSVVCHRGDSVKSGHYYSLISHEGKWYIFDDLKTPCMEQVQMNDKDTITRIKQDCVFVIFRLNS